MFQWDKKLYCNCQGSYKVLLLYKPSMFIRCDGIEEYGGVPYECVRKYYFLEQLMKWTEECDGFQDMSFLRDKIRHEIDNGNKGRTERLLEYPHSDIRPIDEEKMIAVLEKSHTLVLDEAFKGLSILNKFGAYREWRKNRVCKTDK